MASYMLEHRAVREVAVPISVELYHAMSRTGKISERTELLAGIVVEKRTKDPKHSEIVQRLFELLYDRISRDFQVRLEQPLTFSDSEPEPDLALVDRVPEGYMHEHPRTAHLVVEVSNTSLALDRDKAEVYARAGISEYWIVNLVDGCIERYRRPSPSGYGDREAVTFSEAIAPDCTPELQVRIQDLL